MLIVLPYPHPAFKKDRKEGNKDIHKPFLFWQDVSAALSIRLTRLRSRGPPRVGVHQEQGSL